VVRYELVLLELGFGVQLLIDLGLRLVVKLEVRVGLKGMRMDD
jgi:hypothetical protein